ncbi:MAG: hypothetical protein JGK17_21205 [Microcoleus sp. PH2017_10_PVI_O_A]|uniref:hypothetical protein n=1 Tax=unclassified Microcoleus TaxID=2642155 RepID=UPI001D33DFCC|nr:MULTISPECIES: hypothetical protein [unclassified Microcoleus]MCC3408056.1 hypothetical protein [Microcoleus sp. PH2017_10_PVI_O_A]MCC3462176.1 hypothetical protein [Microcoleus sp. PH2017_11_PCY_U_A]MCC3480608.1 hypothetical protein [Microcoleus sp. PH2017_12_PCY_D_A]MCC3530572.1 hypothetical protein [Microcoleus sp. PH2017_21_RUC_O_A]MCC3542957.1 hypothetical protein [Microcoleus sp. PH2017_22_RUC_O_B]
MPLASNKSVAGDNQPQEVNYSLPVARSIDTCLRTLPVLSENRPYPTNNLKPVSSINS